MTWHVFRVLLPLPHYLYDVKTGRYNLRIRQRQDVEQWCMENIQGPWAENCLTGTHHHVFKFKNASDAMLFKLTWAEEIRPVRFGS